MSFELLTIIELYTIFKLFFTFVLLINNGIFADLSGHIGGKTVIGRSKRTSCSLKITKMKSCPALEIREKKKILSTYRPHLETSKLFAIEKVACRATWIHISKI